MKLKYALEMRSKPGLYWADEKVAPCTPMAFATEEEAESYLWQRDVLVVMDASVSAVLWK